MDQRAAGSTSGATQFNPSKQLASNAKRKRKKKLLRKDGRLKALAVRD